MNLNDFDLVTDEMSYCQGGFWKGCFWKGVSGNAHGYFIRFSPYVDVVEFC